MKHNKSEIPAYIIWVNERPSLKGKGKDNYIAAVKKSAQKEIIEPIATNDIDIEIAYSTKATKDQRMDIDNVNKPTLDALKNIAYLDDRQVRSIESSLFDLNSNHNISGRVEHMGPLFFSNQDHVIVISIYSNSRLKELGGEEAIKKSRYKEWENRFNKKNGLIAD